MTCFEIEQALSNYLGRLERGEVSICFHEVDKRLVVEEGQHFKLWLGRELQERHCDELRL
jgi:hypothetical protein